jgi:hypothetical protein
MKPMEMWAAGPFDYLHYYVSRDLLDRVDKVTQRQSWLDRQGKSEARSMHTFPVFLEVRELRHIRLSFDQVSGFSNLSFKHERLQVSLVRDLRGNLLSAQVHRLLLADRGVLCSGPHTPICYWTSASKG